jgi:Ca2+-binding EF-hand superfamily protein
VARYGKAGDRSLPASVLGLSKEALAVLDRDRDGKLSLAELARFGDKPADLTFTVRLGNRSGEALMTLQRRQPVPPGVQVKQTSDGVTLQLGMTRLDLRASRSTMVMARPQINVRAQLKTLFRRADTGNKGYLDRKDVRRGSFFMDTFDAMDQDGDGKVTEKEMLAYFDQMEKLRQLAERSCVSLVCTTEGKGLFDLLDSNGDGKLSVRELRNAPRLLERLAGGGQLARQDVPRHHAAGLALGPGSAGAPFGPVAFLAPRRLGQPRRPAPPRGPLWFQKMDRNRDGDVSRKEFLGTDEQFREIDTDSDGLISVEEAEAYDKRKRAARE